MSRATFEHASSAGWATYHKRLGWRALWCRIVGHQPPEAPAIRNGHSPSNYGRCRRCRSSMKWFVVGQHRYGGLAWEGRQR